MDDKSVSVFVTSIVKEPTGGRIIVEASNGGHTGPPFVRFDVQAWEAAGIVLGQRFNVKISKP